MRAKKSLGQHFLKSKSALQDIVRAGEVTANDVILEIGPGQGALTAPLLATGAKILAVEKDSEMLKVLSEKFRTELEKEELVLLEKDILDFDPTKNSLLRNRKYKLIANIPYYITGEIIRKFLTAEKAPEKMVLLVQKEVANRIMTQDGKESILSISVRAYCQPKFIGTVKAGSFSPPPKVDSAIILFENISKDFFEKNNIDEKKFFELVKTGFAHKRKKLTSNLKEIFRTKSIKGGENSNLVGFDKNTRAEELSLGNWQKIYAKLQKITATRQIR
ncbi:MAG TPA: 16S rRNA (adenine(1518)-N(6)/adenine(1519)-N(6))-dimethyltransferase RsmA [Candidatus Paceibacterota bacterium]|nr:16S rRNA (adenine(1518)-N(6)/adenine(1519)-N(6))-dimethyltransferase RsmA [Candidatus Paceibacterota bacterium]HRZ34245.1 16S rRNA (adenine(1518)-N(6)/adenine(1519)-N(6))-dimethyltransferase RsmA [Candidatus Paceibacterota bacterium]